MALFLALIVVVLIATSGGSVRSWWAHRVHDVTGGSWGADYAVGLAIGLLPVAGVALGALGRGARSRIARTMRMLWFGALGFVIAILLSPSPARFVAHRSSSAVFDHLVPGYLAGAFTAAMLWLAAVVVAVVRTRAWWRRVTSRRPPSAPDRRVIDI